MPIIFLLTLGKKVRWSQRNVSCWLLRLNVIKECMRKIDGEINTVLLSSVKIFLAVA